MALSPDSFNSVSSSQFWVWLQSKRCIALGHSSSALFWCGPSLEEAFARLADYVRARAKLPPMKVKMISVGNGDWVNQGRHERIQRGDRVFQSRLKGMVARGGIEPPTRGF
jgi:hypothetical protein